MQSQTVVFDEVQIGIGLRPLAQHGYIIIEQGVLTLLGTNQQLIDRAALSTIVAAKTRIPLSHAVFLTMNGTKYSVTPGWGNHVGKRPPLGAGKETKRTAQYLLSFFEHNRAHP